MEVNEVLDFADYVVYHKASDDVPRTLLSVELGWKVELALMDDSILVVTNIRSDGYPGLIANLQDNQVPKLSIGVGDPSIMHQAVEYDSTEMGEWRALSYRSKTRADMRVVQVHLPASWKRPHKLVILLGVEELELHGISDGLLEFTIIWQHSLSRQRFSVSYVPSGPMTPDRFSLAR